MEPISSDTNELARATRQAPRVCLGPNAPAEMADFIARAGLEVLPYASKHRATMYVDFVGARPSGVEVLSLDLAGKGSRAARNSADLATDQWQIAACMVISQALRLKPLLLTADPSMLSALRSAMSVAASQVPVIVSGEIGAGKYNFARIIHSASRCGGPLHSLSCASLQDVEVENLVGTLPSSEGHAGSVLFLDEIAELTDGAQLKLLQILQALERTPLLQERECGASFRFVAATNRELATMVERGEFRRELFWRLNVFSLAIPPLRQRAGDIAILAKLFLRRANPRRMFTPMALRVMGAYAFPGNVMELENLVTRLAIAPLGTGNSLIDVPDVRRHLMVVPAEGEPPTSGWKSSREEARRAMILKTIAAAGGNRAEAARRLGITTRALQYHITKAGLSRPSVRAKPAMSRPGATVFHRATPMQDEPTTLEFRPDALATGIVAS
jgi:DNA-binding NtrC family response regulator